jgi:hypothetical protein
MATRIGSCGHRLDAYEFCVTCREYRIASDEAWLVQSFGADGHGYTISRHKKEALAEKRAARERQSAPGRRIVVTHDAALPG